MDLASVTLGGHVRLDDVGEVTDWPSLSEVAADYWRYQRLPDRDKKADDMAARTCVHDLVGEPAWSDALELIDVLLSHAVDGEVGLVAAGPLEELVLLAAQGPTFIPGIETRARQDSRWAAAGTKPT